MLTNNEKKILKFILLSFDKDYSINEISKKCKLTPNGTYKILKKFEKENILTHKKIANIKSYKLNFNNKTIKLLELILIPEIKQNKIKHRIEDIKQFKNIISACIFFGSYIKKEKANDIDILFILEKNNFKKYKKILNEIKYIIPVKIHDVIQTKEDLFNNIIKKDNVILDILEKGIIIWGQDTIVEVIKNVYER